MVALVDGLSTASTGATMPGTPANKRRQASRTSTSTSKPRQRTYTPSPQRHTSTRRTSTRRSSPPAPSPPPSRPRSSGSVQRVAPPPSPPSPPSKKEFLGADDVYQQALRGSRRTLADFLSDIERRRGESKVQYGRTTDQMEEDRTRQLERMKDEFASRGLIHSGLFAKEQSQFQEDFQEQMEALEQQQASLLSDFQSKERDFRREQNQAKEKARLQALQRRAAKFDIT